MTKRPISKSRTAVRAIVFVLIAVLGIGLISPMLVANNDWDKRHVHGFFLEPEDSLDVVLIGASQLYTGYSAPLAWQQYGYDLLDLHDAFDTIGLDRCADFIDSDHLNTAGMEIFTAWLGQYLTAHYDLTGTYSAELTTMWDRCAAFVTQTLPLCKELAAANTEQNLNEFSPQFSAWR